MRPIHATVVATLIALSGGCASEPQVDPLAARPDGWTSPLDDDLAFLVRPLPLEPPGSIESLVADVRCAGSEAQSDPQRCLRRTARIVWTDCVKHSWEAVQHQLQVQGAAPTEDVRREGDDSPWHEYTWNVAPGAYVSPSGTRYDLVVKLYVVARPHQETRGNVNYSVFDGPLIVDRAKAFLIGHPTGSVQELIDRREFADGSAVAQCLASKARKQMIPAEWPVTKLEIAYEPSQPASPFFTDIGYTIDIDARDPKGTQERRGATCRVMAHNDPRPLFNVPHTWLITPPGFKSSDELGPVRLVSGEGVPIDQGE